MYTAFSRSRPPSPYHTHTTYRPSNLPSPHHLSTNVSQRQGYTALAAAMYYVREEGRVGCMECEAVLRAAGRDGGFIVVPDYYMY